MKARGTGMLSAEADPKAADSQGLRRVMREREWPSFRGQRAQEIIETLSAQLDQSLYRLCQSSISDELFDDLAAFNPL
jgi:hypothetical protein